MHSSEDTSRRSLIKLMVMTSPAMSGFTPSLASTEHSDEAVAHRQRHHPWLFYNSISLERMRQTLAWDASEELLAAAFVPVAREPEHHRVALKINRLLVAGRFGGGVFR